MEIRVKHLRHNNRKITLQILAMPIDQVSQFGEFEKKFNIWVFTVQFNGVNSKNVEQTVK